MADQQAFIAAVEAGDGAGVRALIDEDPSLATARDGKGVSVVLAAHYRRHTEIVHLLLEARGAQDLDVFEAVALGRVEPLDRLLSADATAVGRWSPDGFTPLHLAAFFGHADAAKVLLERGADPLAVARNALSVQPLHSAVAGRHHAVAQLLLEASADPNGRQEAGYTPLMQAAMHGDDELVDLLLGHGADLAPTDDQGRSASDFATAGGHDDLARRLGRRSPPGSPL